MLSCCAVTARPQPEPFSLMLQVETARLVGGLYARCMCLHPRQSIIAVVRPDCGLLIVEELLTQPINC